MLVFMYRVQFVDIIDRRIAQIPFAINQNNIFHELVHAFEWYAWISLNTHHICLLPFRMLNDELGCAFLNWRKTCSTSHISLQLKILKFVLQVANNT